MDASQTLTISPKFLLGIYALAPILVCVMVLDLVVFDGAVHAFFPANPNELFWYLLLFNIPHHLASLFSFADSEYLAFYKSKLLFGLPILLGAFAALLIYSPAFALVVFILYTEYHVMSQHQGIFRLLSRMQSVAIEIWKWTGVALLALGYGLTTLSPAYTAFLNSFFAYEALPFLLLFFLATSVMLVLRAPTLYGRLFAGAVALLVISGFTLLSFGYVFLAIFAARFIHDVAAFAFYITHDHNRAQAAGTNVLYRALAATRLPVFVLVPILAVAIGYLLYTLPYISGTALLFLFMTHYFVESFVWKREGLHRRQIVLA